MSTDIGRFQQGETVPIRATLDGVPSALTAAIKPPVATAALYTEGVDSEWVDEGGNVFQVNYLSSEVGRHQVRVELTAGSLVVVEHATFIVERDRTGTYS